MEKWTQQFSEMGSRNKKTGKLNKFPGKGRRLCD